MDKIKVEDAVNGHCFEVFLSTLCVCCCVLAGRATSWRHRDEAFTLGLRLPVRAPCVACLWISFFVLIFPSTCVFSGQVPTPGEVGGGREVCRGRWVSASHTSPWTPHLDVTRGVFITQVYLHSDKALCYGCGMKTGLAGQTVRSRRCNVTHTAPTSWVAAPVTCMIAFTNSELKRKKPFLGSSKSSAVAYLSRCTLLTYHQLYLVILLNHLPIRARESARNYKKTH